MRATWSVRKKEGIAYGAFGEKWAEHMEPWEQKEETMKPEEPIGALGRGRNLLTLRKKEGGAFGDLGRKREEPLGT